MQPLLNIAVGDKIIVYREDRGGSRIPMSERQYINENEYYFRAVVVALCPEKRYNFVRVIDSYGKILTKKRKAYKSKSYSM
jgi:hypothetical protein